MQQASRFMVGDFVVEPQLNRIRRGAVKIRIEPKVMEVLVYLAGRPREVLAKQRILQAVWPDVCVTDDVLIHAVCELRKAFGDDARNARFIQTIPRKGYRLIAPVGPVPGQRFAGRVGRLLKSALWLGLAIPVVPRS